MQSLGQLRTPPWYTYILSALSHSDIAVPIYTQDLKLEVRAYSATNLRDVGTPQRSDFKTEAQPR